MSDVLVLIPARMASNRLPGKPLVDIAGLPMVVHVLRRAEAAKPGYDIAVTEQPAAGAAAAAPAQDEPLEKRLASASLERGETAAKKCQACHTFNKGELNRVGPNLYGVVGRDRGSVPGFNYSAAMKGKPGKWTPEDIDHFLTSPKGFIPGTSMTFAGLPRGSERADVITYLNSKSDHPAQLPKAAQAPSSGPQTR